MEFKAAANKLAREQAARAQVARQRLEAERREAERVRTERIATEEAQRLRRLAALEAEEEARARRAAEVEMNRGILWRGDLWAVARNEEDAAARGIKRRDDKLLLPASVESRLLSQDVARNGPMYFELTAASGRKTHAGLLSFTAAEGTAALPPHVAACLGLSLADGGEALAVRYAALPKGRFCRLQPLSAAFQRDVADLKGALEAALATHSCLTVGDVLRLPAALGAHALRVVELQPEAAVSARFAALRLERYSLIAAAGDRDGHGGVRGRVGGGGGGAGGGSRRRRARAR